MEGVMKDYPRIPGKLAGKMTEQLNEEKNPRGD